MSVRRLERRGHLPNKTVSRFLILSFFERAQIYKFLGDEEKAAADLQKVEELKINKP
jgi:hypothetical protein